MSIATNELSPSDSLSHGRPNRARTRWLRVCYCCGECRMRTPSSFAAESGVEVSLSFVSVWTVRDGKLIRHVAFEERDVREATRDRRPGHRRGGPGRVRRGVRPERVLEVPLVPCLPGGDRAAGAARKLTREARGPVLPAGAVTVDGRRDEPPPALPGDGAPERERLRRLAGPPRRRERQLPPARALRSGPRTAARCPRTRWASGPARAPVRPMPARRRRSSATADAAHLGGLSRSSSSRLPASCATRDRSPNPRVGHVRLRRWAFDRLAPCQLRAAMTEAPPTCGR